MTGWSVKEQAALVARLLPDGGYVNLGIGMPGSVASAVGAGRAITLHCENGILGYRALNEDEAPDEDIIDAASAPVGLVGGAAVVGLDTSFAIARGGRLDVAVLGAFQVSQQGDLANWKASASRMGGIGGAMDLATGARQLIVMMRHVDRDNNPKLVEHCNYPLTAARVVDYIVTDMAVVAVTKDGLEVQEIAPGITFEQLQGATGASLRYRPAPLTHR